MPTYGYRCRTCGSEFEVLQRMSDPPQAACPSCDGVGKRLFYPAGILFKGGGFYKTDSRGTDATASNGSADKAAAATTDTPPATPPPTPASPSSTPATPVPKPATRAGSTLSTPATTSTD